MPCRGAWPHLEELDAAHRDEGLSVLALSDEAPELVRPYLERLDIRFPVGAASTCHRAYGIRSLPHAVLVGPDGRIAWRGDPRTLAEPVLAKVLANARRGPASPLALQTEAEFRGRAAEAARLAVAGEIGKAWSEAARIAADPAASAEEKDDARALATALRAHVDALVAKCRTWAEQREYVRAAGVLSELSRELDGDPLGDGSRSLLKELESQGPAARELEADRELQRALGILRKRGIDRARSALEAVLQKYPGTQAADRARGALR